MTCRLFDVSRSSYKYWRDYSKPEKPERILLKEKVREAYQDSAGSAGARSIAAMVTHTGTPLSRYVAGKLMKELHLHSTQPPKHRYKPAPHEHPASPNALQRQFSVEAPDQVWCGDITYIWIGKQWAYLALVLDLYARKPVGWALSLSPDSALTVKALSMAYQSRQPTKELMFHSDQGCQYSSLEFRSALQHFGIQQSMSRRGNCWDNAPMERFFRSLKYEWVPSRGYLSFDEAFESITAYIVGYYSRKRPHQHNEMLTPNLAEKKYWDDYKEVANFT